MSINFSEIVEKINKILPLHRMWDGFWVHSFKRKTLVISCSFDRIYYRDFDLVFKQVIFFNVPEEWRDTNIHGDELIRLASPEEFCNHHPGFDTGDHLIFAIDIYFYKNDLSEKHTFFVAAIHIYLNECGPGNNNPAPEYDDPFNEEAFPCTKNRVLLK